MSENNKTDISYILIKIAVLIIFVSVIIGLMFHTYVKIGSLTLTCVCSLLSVFEGGRGISKFYDGKFESASRWFNSQAISLFISISGFFVMSISIIKLLK